MKNILHLYDPDQHTRGFVGDSVNRRKCDWFSSGLGPQERDIPSVFGISFAPHRYRADAHFIPRLSSFRNHP
jgi:hypothetical protein